MKHTKFRFATVLLAMWLLFTAIPITVFAELLQLHTEPISNDTVYVLAEDNTKRTAFEKHYYCSNGTFVAVTYPEAVHYQNEQGDWIDVDLRMTDDRVAQAYRSQSGSFKTSFSKPGVRSDTSIMSDGVMTSNAPAVSIESGDYALSWSLVGEQHAKTSVSTYASNGGSAYLSASEQATVQVVGELKTAAPAAAVQKLPITDPGAFELSSVANQVVYENIFGRDQNVSVRYSVSLNKIEEDIMITAPTDMTSFSMQVACGSLTPTLNDDNSVDFLDNDGTMVYHISIPYLVDSACAVSYAVDVTLTVQGESCIITYTPDAAWMQDPARVYPIMLDPAVTTRDYASAISDTYVESTSQVCHLNEQYLRISQDDRAKRVALLKLNHLPSIAENLPIISATLNTCSLMALNHSVVIDVKLEELASDLNLLMVKYNDLNGIGKTEIDRVSLSSTSAVTTFDITSCINNLYSGQSSGCFAISLVGNGYLLSIPPIYSTEQAVVSLRPYVSVTYGYMLPENLSANDSIQLKNLSSGGFLFPNSGLCGAGNYIMHAPDSAALNLRTFNLRVSTVSGAYKLELSPNSDTSNVFVSADLSSELVLLKNASDASANIMQDWLIVPYDATTFKIVLASDMRYVMTAVGSATPYAATPSTSTRGCVSITQCNGAPTNAQLWKIFKGGQAVTNSMALPSLLIDSGIYYVNNRKTGAFISRNLTSSSVTMTSGLLEDIKDQIEWKITRLPDGYYTIQSTQHPNKFLTAQSESAIMATCTGEIEDAQKWHISGSDSQCFFKSALNDKYLYPSSDAATSSQYVLQIGYLNLASEWRVCEASEYVELGDFEFDDLTLILGDSTRFFITKFVPSTESSDEEITYAELTCDFDYDPVDDSIVTVNPISGVVTSQKSGTTQIVVTHKVTGIQREVGVTVNSHFPIITCLENASCDLKQWVVSDAILDSIMCWYVIDTEIAAVDNLGIVTGQKSGYTVAFATDADDEVVFVCELEITNSYSTIALTFTSNEIEYLFCPVTYLNLWTSDLENAFEVKVEILHVLRKYYNRPEHQQPDKDEIRNIFINELQFNDVDRDLAAALFNECYLGSLGLYNEEFLTEQRIAYFNYLKEMLLFCAFGMIAELDPVNTSSNCWGSEDLVYDLSTQWGHNENSKNVMLGPYKYNGVSYCVEANSNGWRYFYSPKYDEFAIKYGDDFVRSINVRYLQRCISDGCQFYFCADPRTTQMTSSQYMEYSYLYNYYLDLWGVVFFKIDPTTGYYFFSKSP